MGDERFIADTMLGKLAKWLRIMGVDVVYDPHLPTRQLLRYAEQEDRILLTRDHRIVLCRGATHRLLIESDYYHEQVRQVVEAFGLDRGLQAFTICLRCNTPLHDVAKQAVIGKVPPYVYATHMEFRRCAVCDQIYWGGTHRDNMRRQLHVMLGELRSTSHGVPEVGTMSTG